MTMARTLKLYKLPDQPVTPGLRQMQPKDVPQVGRALLAQLERQLASDMVLSGRLCVAS